MTDAFLGIDLGTSAVKVLAVDSEGAVLGTGSAEYPILRPHPGWAEQDPDVWWNATIAAVQQAVGWSGTAQIRGVGFSGQMHGAVFVGEHDRPLAPAIIWADQRSARQVGEITTKVGREHLIGIAGSPLATGFMAATAVWMQEEQSSVWWRTKRMLSPKDELRRRMTGAVATDPGDGSASLLFDGRWRNWSPELLDAVETPSILLPPVKPSGAIAGEITAAASEALGVAAGIPVVTGTGDAPSALLGAGIVDATTMLLSLSTGAQVMVPDEAFHPDLAGRTHAFCSALEPAPGQPGWYQMGATLVAGMAMRWLRDEMLQLPATGAYERMTSAAAKAPLGARGLLFLPYLAGERSPHMDPGARGAFLGLAAHHEQSDIVRAVMEGITFACRDAFAALQDAGASPERIVMAGGGSRSPLWRQMVADIFGLPVYALATTDQSAMGAALLAATGINGLNPVETAQRWARYGSPTEPNSARHGQYNEIHEIFREAFAPVVGISHRLGDWYADSTGPRLVPRPIRKRG
ncbi:MAG: xylulokinase [Chloroflexia bacterium]|nr:xylulokinase [Chloroflexia bacterium]